jgi:hypothetical protein
MRRDGQPADRQLESNDFPREKRRHRHFSRTENPLISLQTPPDITAPKGAI